MQEFLPQEIRDGLATAKRLELTRKSRLRVQLGEAVFPILRMWDGGIALNADRTPHLRGLIDIYDGANQIFQCLIVASTIEDGELICEFKRSTPVTDKAALDFWRDENLPVGYLPKQ